MPETRFPALLTQRTQYKQRNVQNTPRKKNKACSNLTQAISCDIFQPCHRPLLAYTLRTFACFA